MNVSINRPSSEDCVTVCSVLLFVFVHSDTSNKVVVILEEPERRISLSGSEDSGQSIAGRQQDVRVVGGPTSVGYE